MAYCAPLSHFFDTCAPDECRTILLVIEISNSSHFSFLAIKDREEIRRRLAMETDSDESVVSGKSSSLRKSHYCKRSQNQSNLQICFLNENPQDFYSKVSLQPEIT